jgi:hypothetical protein
MARTEVIVLQQLLFSNYVPISLLHHEKVEDLA